VVSGDVVQLLDGHPFGRFTPTDRLAPLDAVRLLAPVLPSKVLGVGRNYAAHAAELGNEPPAEPLIFLKPSTAVIGPRDAIKLPSASQDVQHEAELAVVIGRLARNVDRAQALDVVLGYTCGNDVTARDLQRREEQWTRAKGFDTFCPLGPWIDTDIDPAAVTVRCTVSGEVRQDGTTADMVFGVAELVAYCSAFTTLLPGDVILTGTPEGVGPLRDGDTVEVEVGGIGTLSNPVVTDSEPPR
jgi:2-keto-4-pentenoate hydratase/2-oxohepta-3-ene-1,7-dioic acid hydratase in catechol pathway